MSVQTTQTLDIKNFQSYSSVNDTDKILMTKNGADASITIALLREILSRNVKPTIIDGVWHIGAVDTGIKAIGKSPQFQTTANGIEWRYEGDTAWIPLVSYEHLKLKFSDLTPEQFQSLKLTLADLTAEEIAELQRPATETIESVKKVGTDATAAEKLRVGAEEKRATNETARTTKESERLQAETSRVNAEENRASAETRRTGNETTRVSKETERITSEGKRTTSETARNTKESERITAESGRVTAETARVTAESERVLLFKTLKTDSENTTALASEVASHPTYVGVDNYVYVWNKTTKAYDKTTIYVKGEGVDYTTLTPEEKNGLKGLSAYDVAVGNGYVGTVEQWLLSLKGEAGIFDITTEFTELDTINKTIVGAINEVNTKTVCQQLNVGVTGGHDTPTYSFTKDNFDAVVKAIGQGLPIFVNLTDKRSSKLINLSGIYTAVYNTPLQQIEVQSPNIARGFYLNGGVVASRGCVTSNTSIYLSLHINDFWFNPETGFYGYKDFITNITEAQMAEVYITSKQLVNANDVSYVYYAATARIIYSPYRFWHYRVKINSYMASFYFSYCEVIVIDAGIEAIYNGIQMNKSADAVSMFRYTRNLRIIYGLIDTTQITSSRTFNEAFDTSPLLERVHLRGLKVDVSFAKSANLSKESIVYILTNRSNAVGTSIIITLHPTAYAMATGDSEIMTLLMASETYGESSLATV